MAEREFRNLIKTISDPELQAAVEDSAITNAGDTVSEQRLSGDEYWDVAIETAKMILNDPRDFYGSQYGNWQ